MALTYVGELPLVTVCPSSAAGLLTASAGVSAALAPIAIDLTAAVGLQASIGLDVNINVSALIQVCFQLTQNLTAGISLGCINLDFQLAACIELLAELGPIIVALEAAIAAIEAIEASLSTGGIWTYSWTGTGAAFGPAVEASIGSGLPDGSPGSSSAVGVILAATRPSVWGALSSFFSGATSSATGLTETGSLSLGEIAVALSDAIEELALSLTVQLGSYQGQLAGALSIKAALEASPPSLVGNLQLVAQLKSSLEAYLALKGSFVLPTVAITAAANIVADLTELVASLEAQIAACVSLGVTLAIPGILAYTYTGTVAGFGSAIEGSIGSGWPDSTTPYQPSNALVLLAVQPAAQVGMEAFFGGLFA